MHISEGVLPISELIGGFILSGIGVVYGMVKMRADDVPKVGIFTAVFFVASLIHVPIGPSSVHLVLNGLLGIILGWAAFPSIMVALLLQAIFFQFGGLTVLGVNTFNMAFPSVLVYLLFKNFIRRSGTPFYIASFFTGFLAILFAGIFTAGSLALAGEKFFTVSKMILLAHIPIMIVEGIICLVVLRFIKKVKPEILNMEV